MRKTTFWLFILLPVLTFAQVKTTGTIDLSTNIKAKLDLDSATSTATLTLSGPNDRWFALAFGSFTNGMQAGNDVVYWNNTTLVDARQNGQNTPIVDATNNWTVVSNTNNSPVAGQRTIVATRAFSTGDSNDFTFSFSAANIDLAWARGSSASFSLSSHGNSNRGKALNQNFTTLGVEDLSLSASVVYPNPSQSWFAVKTKTALERINVYSQTGAFVKTVEVKALEATEVRVDGLSSGIYLLELVNAGEKAWKKLIVE